MWVKSNGEMPFVYGNHVVKAHVGRLGEDVVEHQGVVVYTMGDVPLVSCLVFPPFFPFCYNQSIVFSSERDVF